MGSGRLGLGGWGRVGGVGVSKDRVGSKGRGRVG